MYGGQQEGRRRVAVMGQECPDAIPEAIVNHVLGPKATDASEGGDG